MKYLCLSIVIVRVYKFCFCSFPLSGALHWLRVPERIVFKCRLNGHSTMMPLSTYTTVHISRRHPDSTKTSVFHFGRSVCSCGQTAYCWMSCFLCRWRACLERSSCRRHFSTFSVHFPKTFKTASLFTLLSWPCPLN